MAAWGQFCAEREIHFHVARVNTTKRMSMAIAAGATSVDGSSASRFAVNLPKLDGASRPDRFLEPAEARVNDILDVADRLLVDAQHAHDDGDYEMAHILCRVVADMLGAVRVLRAFNDIGKTSNAPTAH